MFCHETDEERLQRSLGWNRETQVDPGEREKRRSYIALQLAAAGILPPEEDQALANFSKGMIESLREKNRLLGEYRAPVDQRIESFLKRYFDGIENGQHQPSGQNGLRVPSPTLVLDRHGLARELSIPVGGDHFSNQYVDSHRTLNGIVNNPVHDRRTTAGTFHIVEGGLPISGDKLAVPKLAFINLFEAAMNPPRELMQLPYTSKSTRPAQTWVSLMLRPTVGPEVSGVCPAKTIETRFFAPGSLVSNLDFVESIFGNAGDPLVPTNDAGLDVERWSGHTGCVILAPHLTGLTKKEVGLPHIDDATARQKKDGMCWSSEEERYNNGTPFKLTCRDDSGVVVTLIADNYYGYCKKEVKTQISYAANLMGGVEEEHAGGALAFAAYSLGENFQVNSRRYNGRTFEDVARDYHSFIDIKPEGFGVDRNYSSLIYIPENAHVSLSQRCVRWNRDDASEMRIPLSPENTYIAPSGYQIRLEKHPAAPSWRLVGTVGEGIYCHKPSTVSGGGKSEISKRINDYMLYGPIFVVDQERDFAQLDEIFEREYRSRWREDYVDQPRYLDKPSRLFLDPQRSLGSVIKMLSHSADFSPEYNQWLDSIPDHVYSMALIIKRFTTTNIEGSWRDHFGVDIVNGVLGHELKKGERRLVGTYLRVGLTGSAWRIFKVRQDFMAAAKVQMEDDISATTVVPADKIDTVGPAVAESSSYKFASNCEYRLFQRPDDAIHRGLDKQTELDLSQPGSFLSNFEPLTASTARELVNDVIDFDLYSAPMQDLLRKASLQDTGYVVSSSHPRVMADGKKTKNPRYLQDRPDLVRARETYTAQVGMRLFRGLPVDQPVHVPVGAVLSGRRNNPPDPKNGFRSLAVYSPLHYQELPELMMDYICSLTGKSPSTTGAGSEGALTKRPFNMLLPTVDLNASLVAMILTGLGGFSTPAGHIGPNLEVGHDISLMIPEVWCRMGPEERDPKHLIENRMLEKIQDFEHDGVMIPASRLGYRITKRFLTNYLSRVFDNPAKVFTEEILDPSLQDINSYADGILQITEAYQREAQQYLDDNSIALACPPLQILLHIMASGSWNGLDIASPVFRQMFTRNYLLNSDWYKARLAKKQEVDIRFWTRCRDYLEAWTNDSVGDETIQELDIQSRRKLAVEMLERAKSPDYLSSLVGTLGADPMVPMAVELPEEAGQLSSPA